MRKKAVGLLSTLKSNNKNSKKQYLTLYGKVEYNKDMETKLEIIDLLKKTIKQGKE